MSEDRELLELAAKAAGIERLDFDYPTREGHGMYFGPRLAQPHGVLQAAMHTYWNPLTDDGDSRRLAVALRLDIGFDDDCEEVYVRQANDPFADAVSVPYGDNVEAAARLAVLRMAAEIGRAMTAHNGVDSPANIS